MKLAFVTDLHIGATYGDFHQQTYWPECHGAVAAALHGFLERERVDLLLLGGDMTHATRPGEVARFIELFAPIGVPSILCLGNHDVCVSPETDHLALWRAALRGLPRMRLAPASFVSDAVDVVSVNTRWADASGAARLWYPLGTGPSARLPPEDLAWLDGELSKHATRPAIVMVHGEVAALPPALTGLEKAIHVPAGEYAGPLSAVLDRHPRVRLVLAGHNHVTYAEAQANGRVHTSTGAVSEYPFVARLIEVGAKQMRVETRALLSPPAEVGLDAAKAWAVGRESDRSFTIGLL